MKATLVIIQVLLAYLLGSIPTSVWVGKMFFGVDVRTQGSGNAGATNTLRVFGWKAGLPVLLFDVFKSWLAVKLPVFLPPVYEGTAMINFQIVLGALAVIGHVLPVFAGFRGGKGVASLTGIVIALFPGTFLVVLVIFSLLLLIFRYVSLASVVSAMIFPVVAILMFGIESISLVIFSILVAVIAPILHLKNIRRLLNGTESKIGKLPKNRP